MANNFPCFIFVLSPSVYIATTFWMSTLILQHIVCIEMAVGRTSNGKKATLYAILLDSGNPCERGTKDDG